MQNKCLFMQITLIPLIQKKLLHFGVCIAFTEMYCVSCGRC